MKKFYEKQELWFTIILIVIYVVGQSLMNYVNTLIGVNYSANAILNVALTTFLLVFIFKFRLGKKMGFCKTSAPMSRFLWFIPLAIISTYNLWYGVGMSLKPLELTCYITYKFRQANKESDLFEVF